LSQKQKLGRRGEQLAQQKLLKLGYRFLVKNFRSQFGEIDLIFQDGDTLVFVEVKTRIGEEFGKPEEAITAYKIRRLIRTSQYFQLLHPELPASARIDVVAVMFEKETEKLVYLKHYQNITL